MIKYECVVVGHDNSKRDKTEQCCMWRKHLCEWVAAHSVIVGFVLVIGDTVQQNLKEEDTYIYIKWNYLH